MLPDGLKNFIDTIFKPPTEILEKIVELLGQVSMIAGKGINVGHYFVFFDHLPSSLQSVVNSLLASVIFLAVLILIRAIVRLYFGVKDGIKWW